MLVSGRDGESSMQAESREQGELLARDPTHWLGGRCTGRVQVMSQQPIRGCRLWKSER